MKIGIVGYGWVGRAQHRLFPDAQIYDKYIPERATPLVDCDIAFVAVPTPWNGQQLDMKELEDAIENCGADFIVIRSATQPGFADGAAARWPSKRFVVQPEFLGETPGHPYADVESRRFMIIGGEPADRRRVIEAYHSVYSAAISIRQVSRLEAEVIKLSENRAAFYKIAQCQELYDTCEAAGLDYYTIRDAVYGDDPRMNLWWTFVYPTARGAQSKCIPKDVWAWCAWAESSGLCPIATRSLLEYNETLISKGCDATPS